MFFIGEFFKIMIILFFKDRRMFVIDLILFFQLYIILLQKKIEYHFIK